MPDETCPICDRPVERIDRVDPITYALQPCGHQVDDRTYEELTHETDPNQN